MVSITQIIILGLALIFIIPFARTAFTSGLGQAGREASTAGVGIGTAFAEGGQGLGTGIAGLLNPFFTVGDLIAKFQGLFGGSPPPKAVQEDDRAAVKDVGTMERPREAKSCNKQFFNVGARGSCKPKQITSDIRTSFQKYPDKFPQQYRNYLQTVGVI